MKIRHTNSHDEACALRDQGFEPIECAFGQHGSVLGPLALDHHGTESHREGVALRACRDHYGARRDDPRFVGTGAPDADAVLAIVALAGLVPQSAIDPRFYELVDRVDTAPIGVDLSTAPEGGRLLAYRGERHTHDAAGWVRAVGDMVRALGLPGDAPEIASAIAGEADRRAAALAAPQEMTGGVLLVESPAWGFDVWYERAPIVVAYVETPGRAPAVTLGCRDKQTAENMLGLGGLNNVYSALGAGWGGREAVGGSPRGEAMTRQDARRAATVVALKAAWLDGYLTCRHSPA